METYRECRFEWRGAEVPAGLRALAEVQARCLDRCGRMRALTIERRESSAGHAYRASCRCAERGRNITVSRPSLALTLESFRLAQISYCLNQRATR
jgi:hypothetical protein